AWTARRCWLSASGNNFPVRQDSLIGRAVLRVSGTAGFGRVAPKFIPHIDRFVNKVTGGRFVMSSGMLPSLVLTTTGAKTGQRRTTPLATMPLGNDRFIVVGSNFGQESHPAWSANLLKTPEAEVTFRGRH